MFSPDDIKTQDEVVKYSDIDLAFVKNPFTRDVIVLTNTNSIKRSVLNILRYAAYEIPHQPGFVSIMQFLFEQNNQITQTIIRNQLTFNIEKYEPRVTIDDITATFNEQSAITINIEYTINPLKISDQVEYTVKRSN